MMLYLAYSFTSSMQETVQCLTAPECTNMFIYGTIVGLAIAVPVGPIAFICMQYALNSGFRTAFFAGLGAALADTLFGIIAGLGLTIVTEWLLFYRCWIEMAGGLFLAYIGWELCFTKSHKAILIDDSLSPFGALTSTLMLTLANPLTIIAFIAFFGYFGMLEVGQAPEQALMAIFGVFFGSLSWWTLLTYSTSRFKERLGQNTIFRFRQFGGAALFLFGIFVTFKCLMS